MYPVSPAPTPGSRRGSGYCRQFKHEDNTSTPQLFLGHLGNLTHPGWDAKGHHLGCDDALHPRRVPGTVLPTPGPQV